MNKYCKKFTLYFFLFFMLYQHHLYAASAKVIALQSLGVIFEDPENVYIDNDVTVGTGTFVGAGVKITSGAIVGINCTILSYGVIDASILLDNISASYGACILQGSNLGDSSSVGGLCVVVNTTIGSNTIFGHRSTVFDSSIGNSCTIKPFCNIENSTIANMILVKNFSCIINSTINCSTIESFEVLDDVTINSDNNVMHTP